MRCTSRHRQWFRVVSGGSAPFDAEQLRGPSPGALWRGVGVLKINPLLALDIEVEIFIVVLAVSSVLDEMDVHGSAVQRALNLLLPVSSSDPPPHTCERRGLLT